MRVSLDDQIDESECWMPSADTYVDSEAKCGTD